MFVFGVFENEYCMFMFSFMNLTNLTLAYHILIEYFYKSRVQKRCSFHFWLEHLKDVKIHISACIIRSSFKYGLVVSNKKGVVSPFFYFPLLCYYSWLFLFYSNWDFYFCYILLQLEISSLI